MENITSSQIINSDMENISMSLGSFTKNFEGKTFLITGASGFLGKYLMYLLKYLNDSILKKPAKAIFLDNFATGYEEEIISDENLIFIKHNVIKPFSTDKKIDYIIHAAGIASPLYYTKFPVETMDVGTIGTRNLLELAREKNVEGFIFTSSSEVYGDPDNDHIPTPETYNGNVSIIGPRACYDESKRFAEVLCLNFYRVYDIPIKIVRYFNVYGPGIRLNDYRVLPNFIEMALENLPLTVHGDGNNTRAYCYISDAIEATIKLLFSFVKGEAFNIGNPSQEISINGLTDVMQGIFDNKLTINHISPPHAVYAQSDPKRRCPDISKIQSVIDFLPKYDLKSGVSRTIEWYKETYNLHNKNK